MKRVLLAGVMTLLSSAAAWGDSVSDLRHELFSEERGSADDAPVSTPSSPPRHLFLDLTLGRQFLGTGWSPYSDVTFISVSTTVSPRSSWFWIDGAISVAWASEGIDAEGHPAGPGDSFVELHGGLGHWWNIIGPPFDWFVGAGGLYSWGHLTLPDISQPPLPVSQSIGHPVYPIIEESGNFWGVYLRSEFVIHPGDQWHVGVGGTATLTTTRTLVGRNVSASSANVGIVVGVDE